MSVLCLEGCPMDKQEVINAVPIGDGVLPIEVRLSSVYAKNMVDFNYITLANQFFHLQAAFNEHLVFRTPEIIICPKCGASLQRHLNLKKSREYIR